MSNRHLPMMPWFPKDFIASTLAWSLLERGLYRSLLDASWEIGALPSDPDQLARIAGATPTEFAAAWPRVSAKFEANASGLLVNPRLEEHRSKALKIKRVRAEAGSVGGSAAAASRRAKGEATPIANDQASMAQDVQQVAAGLLPAKQYPPTPSPTPTVREDPLTPTSGGLPMNGQGTRKEGTNPRSRGASPRQTGSAQAIAERWEPLRQRALEVGFRPPLPIETPEIYGTALRLHERALADGSQPQTTGEAAAQASFDAEFEKRFGRKPWTAPTVTAKGGGG